MKRIQHAIGDCSTWRSTVYRFRTTLDYSGYICCTCNRPSGLPKLAAFVQKEYAAVGRFHRIGCRNFTS